MPLHRRLPKRGFTNIFKKKWLEVSLEALEKHFAADDEVRQRCCTAAHYQKSETRHCRTRQRGSFQIAESVGASVYQECSRENRKGRRCRYGY